MHSLMLLATVCWGANIVAGKEALTGFGPIVLAQLRVIGAGAVLVIVFAAWKNRPRLKLTRDEWIFLAVLAFLGITLNQLFFIGGLARSSVAHTGLIVALGPVMVLVLSCLMGQEPLTVFKFLGMLVSSAGVIYLTTEKPPQAGEPYWIGDVILLAGSAVFALYTVLLKKLGDRYDALTLNALIFVLGAVLMVPIAAHSFFSVRWEAVSGRAWAGLAFMVIFGSAIAYLIYAYALTELSAAQVAAFAYLQPVIAAGLGVWILSEPIDSKVIVGGSLILLGVYLAERERREERAAALADSVPLKE